MIYDHVFLIGVDGAGAFFKNADTPNLDYIEKNSPYPLRTAARHILRYPPKAGALCSLE